MSGPISRPIKNSDMSTKSKFCARTKADFSFSQKDCVEICYVALSWPKMEHSGTYAVAQTHAEKLLDRYKKLFLMCLIIAKPLIHPQIVFTGNTIHWEKKGQHEQNEFKTCHFLFCKAFLSPGGNGKFCYLPGHVFLYRIQDRSSYATW